jgi:NADPH2:quinone reductase
VPPFDPNILNGRGSLFLTRPSLGHYLASRDELLWRAGDVMASIAAGELKVRVSKSYSLNDAAQAYRDLEGRGTTGKLVLAIRP